jgi:uncharacterized protein (DUF58 family)
MNLAGTTSRFLDLRAMAALEHMRFVTRHRIEGAYSGRHRSRQQGGAGEFVDFREYVEGEDLRRLDWKVLARTGRAYVRLYQDETNLMSMLCIDASGSMQFGGNGKLSSKAAWIRTRRSSGTDRDGGHEAHHASGSKLEYAQYLATALSHVITRQQDQVGIGLIADGLQAYVEPGATASHAARTQAEIESIQTQPQTRLGDGLRDLFSRIHRRGVLIVMSDFLVDDLEDAWRAIRLFRHRHWEVIVLHLVHPEEERLPQGLAYRFVGLEGEGHIDCSPADVARQYEERFEQHAAMVRSLALAGGCDYRRVSTVVPYLQTLSGFLVERSG